MTLALAVSRRFRFSGLTFFVAAPPYVLVGHSLGGFNVRVYNALYPDEVAGAVLIDASHEDMEARIPRWRRRFGVPFMNHFGVGSICPTGRNF